MSNGKQECIVCAAIKIAFEKCGSHYEIEICETNYDFIRQSWAYSELSFSEIKHETEGFRTNLGRFVDQKEAVYMAIDRGQVLELERLHTRWIQWQLVGDKRWLDVRDQWAELKIELQRVGLNPEDLY